MTTKSRVMLHIGFAVMMAVVGFFVFSDLLFPSVWRRMEKPISPLAGMACGMFFIGIPGLAGMGLGIAIDLIRGGYSLEKLPSYKVIDLIAATQYLSIGLIFVLLHFMMR